MFGRSSSSSRTQKAYGYGNGAGFTQERKESFTSSLLELGRSGASGLRKQQQPPQQPQQQHRTDGLRGQLDGGSSAQSFADAPSFPDKNISITAGTIRVPSSQSTHRSNGSVNSVRTTETYRRVGSIDNNVMASTADRSRGRRERTFVGSECAVCEEPLEHTLRGERILQFQCGHVSHEACFYEFIRELEGQYCPVCNALLHLDTNRGGNVIDIEKMHNIVRGADSRSQHTVQTAPSSTTSGWDNAAPAPAPPPPAPQSADLSGQRQTAMTTMSAPAGLARRGSSAQDTVDSDKYPAPRHGRSDSDTTGITGSGYAETAQSGPPARRHDYDVQAMETTPGSPRPMATRNPIPAPIVTVRSEFPTINRSRQQQTLTCLITIEVPDGKWRPDPEDIGSRAGDGTPHLGGRAEDYGRAPSPERPAPPPQMPPPPPPPRFVPYEAQAVLDQMTENLRNRVDNWHGLDFARFGKLRLYGTLRVGKDKVSWQELECYLFGEMLICVKEKKVAAQGNHWDDSGRAMPARRRCTLKGSILIKKHLNEVTETGSMDENILTLSLSVAELPQFHLRFENRNQLKLWNQGLLDLNAVEQRSPPSGYDRGGGAAAAEMSETEEEGLDWQQQQQRRPQRVPSVASSWGGARSTTTAPTEYTAAQGAGSGGGRSPASALPTPQHSMHVPVDVVVVVPISSSMQGVKINLVRDALRFMVTNLGERDRMGLVTFGSGGGGVPIVGMTTKAWPGWGTVLASIRPVGQKSHRADVVEGANVAMDLLMQRRYNNPIASIMLISDASTSEADSVDFVVSRAEAAKITIHSFGLGMTHKPDTMIELSSRTKASYTYVKDWMMLRECLAGCLGAMQTLSHQNAKLKLKLPEGSPAKFHKISGALQITKRATGRDAEASLGDLRFGDKRDILVQLVILPDATSQEQLPQDPWDNIVSGLEALGGGSATDSEDSRTLSVEEVPLIQADLGWGDVLRDGTAVVHLPRPSLLAITMLPAASSQKKAWQNAPPIPPHPQVVQRRMELLTSDMLTRALTLVSRGQHDRAHTLLNETRSILKGLGKGGLPPVPPPSQAGGGGKPPPHQSSSSSPSPSTPHPPPSAGGEPLATTTPDRRRTPSPVSAASSSTATINANGSLHGNAVTLGHSRSQDGFGAGSGLCAGIDVNTVLALDAELDSALEWISHPAVFGRDSRKAVLQAIGVISSQRALTFRTPIESLWAGRVSGVRRLTERSREWREESGEGGIMEEA